jgi:microcystin-dependent protein
MEVYIGFIMMFAGNFAPKGWAFCNGQLLPISQHTALFSILGTTYGGDGITTFALPDLRGRFPMHAGEGPGLTPRNLGEKAGTETTTLKPTNLPAHTHAIAVSSQQGNSSDPSGRIAGQIPSIPGASTGSRPQPINAYTDATGDKVLRENAVSVTGGSQPIDTTSPFQCINFIIALEGIFPSRN